MAIGYSGLSIAPKVAALGENATLNVTIKNQNSWTVKRITLGLLFTGSTLPFVAHPVLSYEPVSIAKNASKTFSVPFVVDASRFPEGERETWTARFSVILMGDDENNQNDSVSITQSGLFSVISERLDPVITDVATVDQHPLNPHAHFGGYIQGLSTLRITGGATLDPLDSTLVATHSLVLVRDSMTIYSGSNATGIFELGPITTTGMIDWTYTVTDSAGRSASETGSFEVLPYTAPVITTLRAERYKVVLDDLGNPTYPAADDGELVRFTVSADVASVAGKNAWHLRLEYGPDGSTVETLMPLGADGGPETIRRIDDRTMLTAAIPASEDCDFIFTLFDFFGVQARVVSVYKAGAAQHFEKWTAGFGMRGTGTPEAPAFDSAWPINARAGANGPDGKPLGLDLYSTDPVIVGEWIDGKPIYRKVLSTGAAMSNGATKNISLGEVAISSLIRLEGTKPPDANGQITMLPTATYNNLAYNTDLALQNFDNNPTIRIRCGSSTGLAANSYIIIEYTLPD